MYKSDIFALGVILFCLLKGKLPFETATPTNQHYKLLMTGKIEEFWRMHQSGPNSKIDEDPLSEDFK